MTDSASNAELAKAGERNGDHGGDNGGEPERNSLNPENSLLNSKALVSKTPAPQQPPAKLPISRDPRLSLEQEGRVRGGTAGLYHMTAGISEAGIHLVERRVHGGGLAFAALRALSSSSGSLNTNPSGDEMNGKGGTKSINCPLNGAIVTLNGGALTTTLPDGRVMWLPKNSPAQQKNPSDSTGPKSDGINGVPCGKPEKKGKKEGGESPTSVALFPQKESITFKVTRGKDKARFKVPVDKLTYDFVREETAERFKLKVGDGEGSGEFKLKYLDDDAEWMILSSDKDLAECLAVVKDSESTFVQLMLSEEEGQIS